MKKSLTIKTIVLSFLIFSTFISNATININTNPNTDKTLVLSKNGNNAVSYETLEKQTFRIGIEISYQLTHEQGIRKGQIVGFSDDEIIVVNKMGNKSTIRLKDIAKIRKRTNADKISKGIQITSAILGTLTGIGAMDSFKQSDKILNEPNAGLSLLIFIPVGFALASIGLMLLILTLLFGVTFGAIFLVRRLRNPMFRMNNNWKMKIQ